MRGKSLLYLFIAQCLVGCCIGIKSYVLEVGMGFRSPDCVEKAVILINGKFPGPTLRATASTMIEVKVRRIWIIIFGDFDSYSTCSTLIVFY